jgi:hypothetical protein
MNTQRCVLGMFSVKSALHVRNVIYPDEHHPNRKKSK